MSALGIFILISAISILVNIGLIAIIIMMIKNKRAERVTQYNDRQDNVTYFKQRLKKKGVAVEKAIKDAKDTNDFVSIYNDIMSDPTYTP